MVQYYNIHVDVYIVMESQPTVLIIAVSLFQRFINEPLK